MRLPDPLFSRIVSALHTEEPPAGPDGAAVPAAPAEGISAHDTAGVDGGGGKRRAFRRRVNHPVKYVRHGTTAAAPQQATLLDVSAVGVCILCDSVAAPGEELVIYLPCGPEGGFGIAGPVSGAAGAARHGVETIALPCAVRSCRIRSNGMFRVGAEFADPAELDGGGGAAVGSRADGVARKSSRDVLWARVDTMTAADPDAQLRRGERLPADGRATMYLYRGDGGQAPLEQVAVRDFSEHGVAILRGEPLDLGTEFVIRLPRVEDKPITRLCRVVNVAPSDGRYRIGGEFVSFPGRFGRSWVGRLFDWIA